MKNKKGISAIVATVLIILITVAAITIIWAAIIPMVTQLNSVTDCADAVQQLQIKDEGYTCDDGTDVTVQIARGAKNIDLTDIQILLSNTGTTDSYSVANDAQVTPNGASEVLGVNEEKVYTISGATGAEKVQVAPVIGSGGSAKFCDVAYTVMLNPCT